MLLSLKHERVLRAFARSILPDWNSVDDAIQEASGVDGYQEQIPPPGSDPANPEVAAMLRANQENLSQALKKHGFDFADHNYAGNALDSTALRNSGCTAPRWTSSA